MIIDTAIPKMLDFNLSYSLLIIFSILLICITIGIIFSKNLVKIIILMSAFSLLISLCYLLMDAPDVAMTETALGACLSTMILLKVLKILYNSKDTNSKIVVEYDFLSKTKIIRILFALLLSTIFIIVLVDIGADLAIFGSSDSPVVSYISQYYLDNSLNEIGIPSPVAAILASYRGYDTLGETSVILIAGLSVLLILSKEDYQNEKS